MADEDPYKEEIVQEAESRAETRRQAETQRQAVEEYYFGQFPQHRGARALVIEEAFQLSVEHPELKTPGQTREQADEVVRTLGQRVHERLTKASASPSQESRWSGGREPSDAERREAIEEEQAAFQKRRRPPR